MSSTFSSHIKSVKQNPAGQPSVERPLTSRYSVLLIGTLTLAHLINDFYAHVLPFVLPALIKDLKISYFEAGTLALAISLLSGVLSPVFGQLSDRYAWRKRIIIMGFLAFCSGLVLMGLSVSYSMILFAAFIYGLGEFTFHPQSTNFLTRNFPKTRGKVMGIHGIGGAIGNFSAPLVVTGLIALYGWRESLFILIIPGFLIAIVIKFILKEPEKAQPQSLFGGITLPLMLITINFSMIQMFYKAFLTFLPTFLVETGSTMQSAGYIAAMMLFTGFITQPLGGMILDKFGGKTVFLGSALSTTIAMGLFTISSGYYTIICIILIGASIYALFPVALAMASQVAKGGHVGVSVGIVFGFGASLSAFTPMLIGLIADFIGLRASFQYLLFLPICAFFIAFFLPSKQSLTNKVGELDVVS